MITYILFIVWLFLLIKWANLLIQWSWSLAKKFWISDIIIWLTIISFGTSAPEIVVNTIASIKWNSWLVIWNILGSNISNVFLILWIWTIIYPIVVRKWTALREIPFSLISILILWVLANDTLINWDATSTISRVDWVILLTFFAIFLYYTWKLKKQDPEEIKEEIAVEWIKKSTSTTRSILYILLWLAWLTIWWRWIVNWAIEIAKYFDISETIIWLTILAIWTSLPELATVVVATWKKKADIAIWTIVWSNIMNILFIVWISATIHPIQFEYIRNRDIWFAILSSLILFIFMFTGKRFILQRREWIALTLTYIFYCRLLLF